MSSPSHTPNPSPTQSPSQSRSNHSVIPAGGAAPSPSPSPTRGSSSRQTSHPPTPNASHPATPNASQPSSRASSLSPSPHVQHVPRGASSQGPTPPASKSPSQSGLKPLSRNPSLTPGNSVTASRSPSHSPGTSASYIGPVRSIPSYITPYVPRFMKEPPFFQPPTAPLPQTKCFPCPFPCKPQDPPPPPPPPDSLYFPLLPPPPHLPQVNCSYATPPALFIPPSSLTYSPPIDVLVGGKPHVVPTVLPATFYTPFSRYYSQPRPYRTRRLTPFPLPSQMHYDSPGRSVHFYRGS
ncbi:uncharacterized protein [Dipodomys merriami]|uniref:uncharacterized protein n=1 Tax=Dipodomys merriami TaxID=94247 RepID=UPI0038557D15